MSESVNAVAADLKAAWVADGTPSAEPVTVETPAAPVVEAAAPETPRDEAGKFVATPAAEPPAANAVAAAQAAIDMLEARLGESTVQIPKGALIPLKRGETVEQVSIEELQKRGMLELDYRHKTAALGEQKRAIEAERAQMQAEQARIAARQQWIEERNAEMVAAQKDPQKWEAYQESLRMYEQNPHYRQMVDDALAKRETEAEIAVYRERDQQETVQRIVTTAAGWVEALAAEYPTVSPDRIKHLYGQAIASGQAPLTPDAVRSIYEQEAGYLAQSATPLTTQLAALKAQVEALTAATAAEKSNATTTHAIARAKTPPVTTTGRPAAPASSQPAGAFGPRDLPDRNAAWANQR